MLKIHKPIPQTSRKPFIGNAMDLFKDPVAFALREYHDKGPVFEAKILNKKVYFAAGLDANIFFSRNINEFLSAKEVWRGYTENYNANIENFLLAMEGKLHAEQRRLFMRGFSPKMLEDRFDLVSDVTVNYLAEQIGEKNEVKVVAFVQRLIMEQLGMMCANTRPGEYYEDLTNYIRALLNVHVINAWPKAAFSLPKYRKARKRSWEFADKLIASHMENRNQENPDLIDDMIAAYESKEFDLEYNDLRILVTSPFSAGMDTITNTFAMTLYVLANDVALKTRIQEEVERHFVIGQANLDTLKEMPLMHALFMEVLRLYPVAPYIPRTVSKAFEYEGYHFKEGQTFYVAQVVTHFLDELFPNPTQFDIDRFLPPREEHKQRGALNPYGMGAHKCLGLRLGEMQMMFSLCHLMKLYDWKLFPENYQLKTRVVPTIGPEPNFTLQFFRREK
jgi:cytochrome P450